jgi:outer membrane protein assembly factor BamB
LLLGAVNAGCTNFRPPPPPVPAANAGDPPPELWHKDVGRGIFAPVALDDSTLYVAGSDRRVAAVRLADGERRWHDRFGGAILGGIIREGRRLYVATGRPDGKVRALQTTDGKSIWDRSIGPVGVPLALIGGQLIALTEAGGVVALDTAHGAIRWRRRVGPARAPAIGIGGAILVSTVDSLFRLSSDSGRVLARKPTPGTVLAGWKAEGDLLIAGTTSAEVVALHPQDLSNAWRVKLDAPVFTAPAFRGDTAYVVSRLGTLYRLALGASAPTPEVVARLGWPVTVGPVLIGGDILLGGADGILRGLDHQGRERWRVAIWQPIDVPPLPLSDGFLALGGNGDLHRFGQ